jgi:DNA-binding SARP family transcriptional activator/tetratricopeptide (TPR) repeat protein
MIVTRPPGYGLRLDPDGLDAARFERLAASGRREFEAGQHAAAAAGLAAALGLWRGEAYGEFGHVPALLGEGARLERLRLVALGDRIDADLATGMGVELVAELEGLTGRYPGHERLWGQLMTVLYRAGQQADALAAFRRARQVLVEECGVEPSPGLAEIHRQVLAQDPRLLHPRSAGLRAAGVRPAQLPPSVPAFTARVEELAALDEAAVGAGRPSAVVISAVSGTAGVGKTALAVHWAHQVVDRFPDGQLYVNLRGFDPGGQPMPPTEAIRGFLDALGVSADRMPPTLDAQVGLYRSLLNGKRMLVVLDNARDAEHASALLPGTPTALAVVTSRSQLTPLVAAGARPVTLDLLSRVESRELLTRRLGRDRVTAEPDAVEEIIARCARLPLALSIAAARAQQSGFPLSTLAADLGEAGHRLDALDAGGLTTQVRAVFSCSYTALTAPAARLFRLVGLHPGPDTSAAAAASLAGRPLPEVRPLLAELVRASLLSEHACGRYTFHDLLRAYAGELARRLDSPGQRRAATDRLIDHYLHTAAAADRQLAPHRPPPTLPLAPPGPGTTAVSLPDYGEALAWLDAEHPGLLAAVRHAAGTGREVQTWQLSWALDTFLYRRAHLTDLASVWTTALAAATRLDNPAARAYGHGRLARLESRLGCYPDARRHLYHALDLYTRTGDRVGQANTHFGMSYLFVLLGQPGQARYHIQQALTLYRAVGDRHGQAGALITLGWTHAQLGDPEQALIHCTQALTQFQKLDNCLGEADAWDTLGQIHQLLAHHTEAADCYQRAITRYRDLGDRYQQATTTTYLGDTHQAAGRSDDARTAWQLALGLLADLDHPDADALRAKLDALEQATPPHHPEEQPNPGSPDAPRPPR